MNISVNSIILIIFTIFSFSGCPLSMIESKKATKWVDTEANYVKQKESSLKLSMAIIDYYLDNNIFPSDNEYIATNLSNNIYDYMQSRDGKTSTIIFFIDKPFTLENKDRYRGFIYLVALMKNSLGIDVEIGFSLMYIYSHYASYIQYKETADNDYLNWPKFILESGRHIDTDTMISDGLNDPILFKIDYFIDKSTSLENIYWEWR